MTTCDTWRRLDVYRTRTGKTLQQLHDEIGVGISMLMMVKSGRRNLSKKALFRLEEAERAAGIMPESAVFSEVAALPSEAVSAPLKGVAKKRDFSADEEIAEILDQMAALIERLRRALVIKASSQQKPQRKGHGG